MKVQPENDVAVAAITTEVRGEIGRDLIGAGGRADVGGIIGRNVQGWFYSGRVDAVVGNDVDVRVGGLEVGANTDVAGDLLYRADSDAAIADGAQVAGSLARLSTRSPFVVRVSIALFTIFGVIAFTLLGLLVLWASRSAAPRAAGAVVTRTGRAAWVGLVAVVGAPFLAWMLVLAVAPFLAKVGVVVLFLVAAVTAVLLGPIPALAALGDRLTRGRAGLLGGFVIGVVVWRALVWAVPLLGLLVSFLLLVFGIGGWLTSWWARRSQRRRARLLPAPVESDEGEGGETDWEPPLPPLPVAARRSGDAGHDDGADDGAAGHSES